MNTNLYERGSTSVGTYEQRSQENCIAGRVGGEATKISRSQEEKMAEEEINNRIITKEQEEWKTIEGFPDYQISNRGRIWSNKTNKFLKKGISKTGYRRLNLLINGKRYMKKVHILLALHFIPNPHNLPNVDHEDRNKLNNNLYNLRWCNQSINSINANIASNNTSGVTGVYWVESKRKWKACIMIDRKTIHLGYSSIFEEACKLREIAVKKYWKYQSVIFPGTIIAR